MLFIPIDKNAKATLARLKKYEDEKLRLLNMLNYENRLYDNGITYIAGIDEVGRGPLAGPVVTCALILKKDILIEGINDSKKVSEAKREKLFDIIITNCEAYSLSIVNNKIIDNINILNATKQAMIESVKNLKTQPQHLFIDALKLDLEIPQTSIIKGDSLSLSIASASIVAKVTRDRMMIAYDELYPQYGFANNKGYGTKEHIAALKKYGPTPIHRKSFIRNI